ncbi:MAG: D-glycero-beta-D-manno-heptose-7-phosphate kinase [Proteobacteria bacterium]|nr:D-glycero-beta-D-manno-heptose-7-phosphate kinase [Pseudomonadota bacterium]
MKIKDVEKLLESLKRSKILAIGDIGLDNYIVGDVKKISPEAPVPIVEVKEHYYRLGLSANVANNVKALGAKCDVIGVIGDDSNAAIIKKELQDIKIDTDGLIVDKNRPTTHKTRVLASRLHHVVRIDREDKAPLSNPIRNKIIKKCKDMISGYDVIILEDYAKGFFKNGVASEIIDICHKAKKSVFVDPSRYTDPNLYKGATLLKPNFEETRIISGVEIEDEKTLYKSCGEILKRLDLEYLVVTRGKDGMTVFSKKHKPHTIPTFALEVFDVSGAGDTVIASLALAYSAGMNIYDSAFFANTTAAIVVAKVGTAVVTPNEIIKFLQDHRS